MCGNKSFSVNRLASGHGERWKLVHTPDVPCVVIDVEVAMSFKQIKHEFLGVFLDLLKLYAVPKNVLQSGEPRGIGGHARVEILAIHFWLSFDVGRVIRRMV